MILTSWKHIASHLHCAVRTAQRWERNGLPVNRPHPGRRSYVVANAELLDSWLSDTVFWNRNDLDRLAVIQRSRELRGEAKYARQVLRQNMALLRGQAECLRQRIEGRQGHTSRTFRPR